MVLFDVLSVHLDCLSGVGFVYNVPWVGTRQRADLA